MQARTCPRSWLLALFLLSMPITASAAPPVCSDGPASNAFIGSALITTQAEADAFTCYQRIYGSLTLADSPALSLALPNLRAVYGPVHVVYSSDAALHQVRTVSLPVLTTIMGSLTLDYPGASGAFYGAEIGLGFEALVNMLGDIVVNVDNSGANLTGLSALARLVGDLTVSVTSGDVSGGGFLSALHTVTGDVAFIEGHNTFNLLPALIHIGGSLHLDGLLFVLGVQGQNNFGALRTVTKNLELFNLQLALADPLVPLFHSLTFVGRKLVLQNVSELSGDPLALSLGSTSGLWLGGLRMVTSGLNAIDPAAFTLAPWGTLSLQDNPLLCQASAEQLIAQKRAAGFFGPATATNNGSLASCP